MNRKISERIFTIIGFYLVAFLIVFLIFLLSFVYGLTLELEPGWDFYYTMIEPSIWLTIYVGIGLVVLIIIFVGACASERLISMLKIGD